MLPAHTAGRLMLGELSVHRLGFGAMRVTGPQVWGPPKDRKAAVALLRRAVELGVDFFDTADSYGPDVSEELIAEALHPYPAGFVIGTKGGLLRPTPPRWDSDAHPTHLKRALEGSLRRLKLECIDLYQLHAPDPAVPFEDSVGALAEAQREGKIRHVGLSNVSVTQLYAALKIVPIVSVQNRFSLDDRSSDDVLAACTKRGIAFLPWYPLGAGSALKRAAVKRVAGRRGVSAAQVAIAWLLAKSPVMLPIPGTSSVAHLEENVASAALVLAPEDLKELG